jgi:hypothetical protein
MKTLYIIAFFLLYASLIYAQEPVKADTIKPGQGPAKTQLKDIKDRKKEILKDSTGNQPAKSELVDTTIQNKYGDLLRDDTAYNKRSSFWKPAIGVPAVLAFTWSVDRFILNADYARIGISTWKYNIQKGWEWDNDRFGINFVGHPYSGALTFNSGRSNGYNFLQSFGFSVAGSVLWEYFGENTRPSYNDVINTPVSGAFLGEIMYRLSSNILDDRTQGSERVFREILAGLIDPMRGVNRLLQGKTFKVNKKEVYEKNPLNVSLYAGIHSVTGPSNPGFGTGTNSLMINTQFDYGNPFEIRQRKPFDFFKLRVDLNFGVGRKYLDNVIGYGILFGKNMQLGKIAILAGAFQYYDYWDNKTFELGTIGLGGGIITKLPVSKTSDLYTNFHLAIIPLAGNSTRFGPDTSQLRDYNFGYGLEGKAETTLNMGTYATTSLVYYYYMIRTGIGAAGDNFIGILKPRITVHLFKDLNIGYEHFIYYNDRYLKNFPAIHSMRIEDKLFLMFYFESAQRKGKYN